MRLYKQNDKFLLDIERIIPLPEADEYQVHLSEKRRKEKLARKSDTLHDVTLGKNTLSRLTVVRAILATFIYLVEQGVSPEAPPPRCGGNGNWRRLVGGCRARLILVFRPEEFQR